MQEDLREVDTQVSYAAKQHERCAYVKEFSKALDVSKELDELRKKKISRGIDFTTVKRVYYKATKEVQRQ